MVEWRGEDAWVHRYLPLLLGQAHLSDLVVYVAWSSLRRCLEGEPASKLEVVLCNPLTN
jgi:hypothetical protein